MKILFALTFLGFYLLSSPLHVKDTYKNVDIVNNDTIKINWNPDRNKSFGTTIELIQSNNQFTIHCNKPLNNLYIGVTNMRNQVMHSETANIPADTDYFIDLSFLEANGYYFTLIQGSNYAVHSFEIE